MEITKNLNFFENCHFSCNGNLSEKVIQNFIHSSIIVKPRKRSTTRSMEIGVNSSRTISYVGPKWVHVAFHFLLKWPKYRENKEI